MGGGTWQVADLSNPTDVDQLIDIEMITFDDGYLLA
jgi:hypothetical protein